MPEQRKGEWIQTFSGIRFWPLDPRPEEVRLDDVAHALAMTCRFNGHCDRFYSVAQHCVHVSELCDDEHALAGLIHDAAEAYISDLSRPVKRQAEMGAFRAIEAGLERAVAKAFGVDVALLHSEQVKRADHVMLATEAQHLMRLKPNGGPAGAWDGLKGVKPLPNLESRPFRPWGPDEAKARFKERFGRLALRSKAMADA